MRLLDPSHLNEDLFPLIAPLDETRSKTSPFALRVIQMLQSYATGKNEIIHPSRVTTIAPFIFVMIAGAIALSFILIALSSTNLPLVACVFLGITLGFVVTLTMYMMTLCILNHISKKLIEYIEETSKEHNGKRVLIVRAKDTGVADIPSSSLATLPYYVAYSTVARVETLWVSTKEDANTFLSSSDGAQHYDAIIFSGHGNEHELRLTKRWVVEGRNKDDCDAFINLVATVLKPTGTIVMNACSTGKDPKQGGISIARWLLQEIIHFKRTRQQPDSDLQLITWSTATRYGREPSFDRTNLKGVRTSKYIRCFSDQDPAGTSTPIVKNV
jgi:hypothetical protein